MKQAYDCGINFFDTAERLRLLPVGRIHADKNSYAGGQSEVIMGQAIKKYMWKRNDIVISTKVCPGLS